MRMEDHPFLKHYFELQRLQKTKDESLLNQIIVFSKELWFEIHFKKWKNDFKHQFREEIKRSFHYD